MECNLRLVKRLCELLGLNRVEFCYKEDTDSFSVLPKDYDAIWCQVILHHAPFDIVKMEANEITKHLPIGGRWIELSYPEARWKRDGKKPFNKWGEVTDGPGTQWAEWYDLEKLKRRLAPAELETVLYFEFCNSNFNWFDLLRVR